MKETYIRIDRSGRKNLKYCWVRISDRKYIHLPNSHGVGTIITIESNKRPSQRPMFARKVSHD